MGLPGRSIILYNKSRFGHSTHSLNLRRWRLRVDAKCALCDHFAPTTFHILNGCPVALEQDRYTWRHDSILQKKFLIVRDLRQQLPPELFLYCDLDGWRASDNPPATIPPKLLVTSARPDIVIQNGSDILLLELTVPHNTRDSFIKAHERKIEKENYCRV